jgi:N-acetylglucosamine malate deacetylase 2
VESPASTFLTASLVPERVVLRPVMVVVAHPDDEFLGVGSVLPQFRNLRAIVHVTDGAPRCGPDAAHAGANSWQEYAALRRCEFLGAMRSAGVRAEFICLGHPDQAASFQLLSLTAQLRKLCQRLRPAVLFTHSYEGGHPDHDCCAFLSHRIGLQHNLPVWEMPLYHRTYRGP